MGRRVVDDAPNTFATITRLGSRPLIWHHRRRSEARGIQFYFPPVQAEGKPSLQEGILFSYCVGSAS